MQHAAAADIKTAGGGGETAVVAVAAVVVVDVEIVADFGTAWVAQ